MHVILPTNYLRKQVRMEKFSAFKENPTHRLRYAYSYTFGTHAELHTFSPFCLYVSFSDVVFSTSLHFHMYTPITSISAAYGFSACLTDLPVLWVSHTHTHTHTCPHTIWKPKCDERVCKGQSQVPLQIGLQQRLSELKDFSSIFFKTGIDSDLVVCTSDLHPCCIHQTLLSRFRDIQLPHATPMH